MDVNMKKKMLKNKQKEMKLKFHKQGSFLCIRKYHLIMKNIYNSLYSNIFRKLVDWISGKLILEKSEKALSANNLYYRNSLFMLHLARQHKPNIYTQEELQGLISLT